MAEHEKEPITARIADLSWMAGTWKGYYDSDSVEEDWSSPAGGCMMGMFRWLRDDKPRFFELILLVEDDAGVAMRFKHFSPEMKGWEEKDECLIFDLVHVDESSAKWSRRGGNEWLLYRREGEGMEVWFEHPEGEKGLPGKFKYKRS